MFLKIFRSVPALSVFINVFFLLLYIALSNCKYPSMDDFFMSSILTGAYGSEYDVHLYFVNVLYGFFLKPFYFIFPDVGWYYIFEVAEVFAAFTMLTYLLLTKVGMKIGAMLSVLLLVCLSPAFYFQVSFTQNAALLSAVGFTLMAFAEIHQKKLLISGIVFSVAGFVMRSDAFLLGIPCLGILLLSRWMCLKKFPVVNFICVLFSLIFVFAAFRLDRSFYQEGEWRYYAEYQGPRSIFGDGQFYDRDATLDEIEERGMYGMDYTLLTRWVFNDTENFTKDSLDKFIRIVDRNRFAVVPTKMPFALARHLAGSFQDTRTWPWIVLCFLAAAYLPRKLKLVPWASLAYIVMAYSYLLMKNRVVYHVESGVWIYAMMPIVALLTKTCLEKAEAKMKYAKSFAVLMILLYGIGYWGVPGRLKAETFQESPDKRWIAFLEYEEKNPDTVFFLDFSAYNFFGMYFNKAYRAVSPGRFDHVIPLGYWNVNLPGMKRTMKNLGVDNPMKSLAKENVLVVQYDNPMLLVKYCRHHYQQNLNYDNLNWTSARGKVVLDFEVSKYYNRGSRDE
ncbi:MAG: hypothetical protein HUK20_08805 [Fibrobacter sp.]|nr:hypothetical protein [Fibrobacter sp.]